MCLPSWVHECPGMCRCTWVYLSVRLWVGEQLFIQLRGTVVNVSVWTCLWEQDSVLVHLFACVSHMCLRGC